MNITPFEVYWIMQSDTIRIVCILFSILFLLFFFINLHVKYRCGRDELSDSFIVLNFLTSMFFIIAFAFIPTTNSLMAMYIIPRLSHSQIVQNIPAELQFYINNLLIK